MAEQKKTTPKKTVRKKKPGTAQTKKPTGKAEKPVRKVGIKKLFRGKTEQEKRERKAVRDQKRIAKLEKLEESYSVENYVTEEEAMGPAIYNPQYLKKAAFYRTCGMGVVALLIVFVIGMLLFFKDEITIENFRYLIRNVDFELRNELSDPGVISYDSNPLNTFAVYKDSLVQMSDRKLAIYDASGHSSYVGNLNYTSPALCTSDRYVLAFDRDSGDYSLYTGFNQSWESSTKYPISDVDIAKNGVHVIASRSKNYIGTITVYSASFKEMNVIRKNKHIAAVDLTEDGKNLLFACYSVEEDGLFTELMAIPVNSETPTVRLYLSGIIPWEVRWLDDGRFLLICDEGVKFFDETGKIYYEYGFSDKNVIEYKVCSTTSRIAVICREDNDTTGSHLYLLSADGTLITQRKFDTTVGEITFWHDRIILLSDKTAWQIAETGDTWRYDCSSVLQAAAADSDTLYLCTHTRVVTPDWKEQSDR